MKDYKRLTNNNLEEYDPEYDFCIGCKYFGEPNGCNRPNGTCDNYERFIETYDRLAELEDKIENGTLVFKKEIPNNYYALVLHRDCSGKNSWHIHHVPIEYEKENNRVAIQVNGILYVTTKNMLFKTKAEAEAKWRELKE